MPTLVTTIQVNELGYSSSAQASAAAAAASAAAAADAVPEWQGDWLTATAYTLNDLVLESSIVYICTEAHTSGTFATDLTASKWSVYQDLTASFVSKVPLTVALSGASPVVINLPSYPDAVAWDVFIEGVYTTTPGAFIRLKFGTHDDYRFGWENQTGGSQDSESTSGGVTFGWGYQNLAAGGAIPAGQHKGSIQFRLQNLPITTSIAFTGVTTFDPPGGDPEALDFTYQRGYISPKSAAGTLDGTLTVITTGTDMAGTVRVIPVALKA